MSSNLDRFRKDLDVLETQGAALLNAMRFECFPNEVRAAYKEKHGDKAEQLLKALPSFLNEYQGWYSEAKALIKQLLPHRLEDFVRHYEKPRPRKELNNESYRIEDYLLRLSGTRGSLQVKVFGPDAAIPHFQQQLAIVDSAVTRFESSLFDIRQLVQADLFDSELDAARELWKSKFTRAAGALAGVVLERHLEQVCGNHSVKIVKRNPTISDYNDALKNGNVIDTAVWRSIQYLADIRNVCDHSRGADPTLEHVNDLISGVGKVTKTIY